MVEGIDGIGEAVTGGMAARAIEPSAGEGGEHGQGCLNCGTKLAGPHCHQCGQKAHVHRTLGAFGHDIAHSVLHFEGKIWRTLPLLAWRPGELTRRYVEGERARFVSPMALFLFSVFLMFAVFSTLGGPIDTGSAGIDQTPAEERAEAQREFNEERAESVGGLNALRQERARLVAAKESTLELDIDIRNAERELALEEKLFKQALTLIGDEEKRDTEQAKAAEGEEAGNKSIKNIRVGHTGEAPFQSDWFNDAYKKAKENPTLLIYKLQTNAYKFSWALIPISVPFVWLLFLHRRRYRQYKVYDHTVFVTYSIAFMSLGVIALSLLRPLGLNQALAITAITFIPPFHMYRQLRGAYQLSRWSALWRTAALLFFASLAAGLFMLMLLALGVLG